MLRMRKNTQLAISAIATVVLCGTLAGFATTASGQTGSSASSASAASSASPAAASSTSASAADSVTGVRGSITRKSPTRDQWNNADEYAQLKDELFARDAQADIDWAPTVTTLADGTRVQKVPFDNRHWNTYVLDAENRGCNACHNLEDMTCNTAWPHQTIKTVEGAEMNVDICIACHDSLYTALWGSPFPLRDAIHGVHLSEGSAFNGTCDSCHYIDDDGNYLMWDDVKNYIYKGLTAVANVDGDLKIDQDVVTPNDELYTLTNASDPHGQVFHTSDDDEVWNDWNIEVDGECANPYTIDISEVPESEMVTRIMKSDCMINDGGMISNVEFTGIDLQTIVDKAQINDGVNSIVFHCEDGADIELPIVEMKNAPSVLNGRSMLALQFNGERVPAEFGYPVVLEVGEWISQINARDIQEIEFKTFEDDHSYSWFRPGELDGMPHADSLDDYSSMAGNPNHAFMNVEQGQIFNVGEPITFEGYADAYGDTITALDFSLDNGVTWTKYDVNTTSQKWVYFYYTVDNLEPGSYVLSMRAYTDAGRVSDQPSTILFNIEAS